MTERDSTRQHTTKQNGQEPLLLRVEEAARMLRLGRATVYMLVASGELPCVRIGRAVRVPTEALRRWIETHTTANGPPQKVPA